MNSLARAERSWLVGDGAADMLRRIAKRQSAMK